MKKSFRIVYILCWCCLCWGAIAAIPHTPIVFAPASAPELPLWFRWLVPFLILEVLLLLLNVYLRMTAGQSRRIKGIFQAVLIGLVILSGELIFGAFRAYAMQLGWVLGGLFVGLLIAAGVLLDIQGRGLTREKNSTMWKTILLLTAAIGLTVWIPGMWGLRLPVVTLPGDLLEYYIGQLSLTFITISVMSVLSDKSVIIYWENVAEAKLIQPLFGSFASYTGYSIAATVGAGISVLLGNGLGFSIFFAINILVLILLTLTMVDVYYGREQKKADRARLLRAVAPIYMQKGTQPGQHGGHVSYKELMQNLQYHLYQEIEAHNIPYVREVAELCGGNIECFDTPEGQAIRKLLESSDLDLLPMMADGIAGRVSELERRHAATNVLANNQWREDHLLWAWLAKEEHISEFVLQPSVRVKMYGIVLRRLTLLMNDILSNSVPLSAPAIRSYEFPKGYSRTKVSRSDVYLTRFVQKVLPKPDESKNSLQQASERKDTQAFFANLMRITFLLREQADPYIRQKTEQHLAYSFFLQNYYLWTEEEMRPKVRAMMYGRKTE